MRDALDAIGFVAGLVILAAGIVWWDWYMVVIGVCFFGTAAIDGFARPHLFPHFETRAEELIWRSTGIFGDFDFPLLCRILELDKIEFLPLKDSDIQAIIKRYHEHVSCWNIPVGIIRSELIRFANDVGEVPNTVIAAFNTVTDSKIDGFGVKM